LFDPFRLGRKRSGGVGVRSREFGLAKAAKEGGLPPAPPLSKRVDGKEGKRLA